MNDREILPGSVGRVVGGDAGRYSMGDLMRRPRGTVPALIDAGVGISLYLATVGWAANAPVLVALAFLVVSRGFRRGRAYGLPLIFAAGAMANLTLHAPPQGLDGVRSATVMVVAAMALLAPGIRPRAWVLFILLVVAECLVAVAQFAGSDLALGLASSQWTPSEESSGGLLYAMRVPGLSTNSSVLAFKIFTALVIMTFLRLNRRAVVILLGVLALGLVVTFNRSTLATVFVLSMILLTRWTDLRLRRLVVTGCVILGVASAVALSFPRVQEQFLRGNSLRAGDLNRVFFLQQATTHILEHPFVGNGSVRYRVRDLLGEEQHAHNSFLMLIATHGSLLGVVLLAFLALRTSRDNWWGLLAFGVLGLAQYVVFWNASTADMALYWIAGGAGGGGGESGEGLSE